MKNFETFLKKNDMLLIVCGFRSEFSVFASFHIYFPIRHVAMNKFTYFAINQVFY